MSDRYKRIKVSKNGYQCGCKWIRNQTFGDVLIECEIHKQVTMTSIKKMNRNAAESLK
jgi:hypothetical protein